MALGHDNTGKAQQAKQDQQKPDWAKHQQKPEEKKTRKDAVKQSGNTAKAALVKVHMKTDYRDVAKAGDVFETDAEKADELIRLGRAEVYVTKKKK